MANSRIIRMLGGRSRRSHAVLIVILLTAAMGSAGIGSSSAWAVSAEDSSATLGAGFTVPGGEWLLGPAQETIEQRAAAAALRRRTRTAFRRMTASAAARIAGEAFPNVLNQTAGGLPRLGAGEAITGYPSDHLARLRLAGGRHAVIVSAAPIALSVHGARRPVDLRLSDKGAAFEPRLSPTHVWIPKRLGSGSRLPAVGVSLTPVAAGGSPLAGAAASGGGAAAFYGNTALDSDTVIKPTLTGLQEDTILRSAASPERLYFRLGIPRDAKLVQRNGGLSVLVHGRTVAVVPAVTARDAALTPVPVSATLHGDTIALTIPHREASYRYPIDVDPTVVEQALITESFFGKLCRLGVRDEQQRGVPETLVQLRRLDRRRHKCAL